jgi:hypothetical protein
VTRVKGSGRGVGPTCAPSTWAGGGLPIPRAGDSGGGDVPERGGSAGSDADGRGKELIGRAVCVAGLGQVESGDGALL